MSDTSRVEAPTAAEIERRFGSATVRLSRPMILGGLGVLRTVRRFGWRAEGTEHLPAHRAPLIFAANHVSHSDTAAILGTLPPAIRRRTCVAAALDVFGAAENGAPALAGLRRECLQTIVAAGFHAFAFDRHGRPLRSVRTAVELIDSGWSLLLYPEGTRSRTGVMAGFKSGVGVLAKVSGARVIPIHVSGGDTILPCGRTIPGPGRALVRYGAPMRHEEGEKVRSFVRRLQARVQALAPDRRPAQAVEPAPGGGTSLAALSSTEARQPSP